MKFYYFVGMDGVYFVKLVLKEVVDVVFNLFVKYMYGYGRGKLLFVFVCFVELLKVILSCI